MKVGILSDGKPGHLNQSIGVATILSEDLEFNFTIIDLSMKYSSLQALSRLYQRFLCRNFNKINAGKINAASFTEKEERIRLHGHCHQKANSSLVPSKIVLGLPKNYKVQVIPSGCCGMAGSFGYEKGHYDISMKIGELILFPSVRKEPESTLICAPGRSCRHQIKDGTEREALHPVEILFKALVVSEK